MSKKYFPKVKTTSLQGINILDDTDELEGRGNPDQ